MPLRSKQDSGLASIENGSEMKSIDYLSPAYKSNGFNDIFMKRNYGKINSLDLNFCEFSDLLNTENS